MSRPVQGQVRSRRIMLAMGALALLLMTGPWLLRQWNEGHATAGKVAVYRQAFAAPPLDTAMCLLHREPGGLMLSIESENNFAQTARQLAVRIEPRTEPRGSAQTITAWLPRGGALSAGELAQLQRCAANPGKPPAA